LESILDGEHVPNSKEILQEKLDKCQPCFQHFHLEQAIREVLRTKCSKQEFQANLWQGSAKKFRKLNKMPSGKAIIFSAPSGSGKTTIVRHLLSKFPNLGFSISASTRDKRGRTEQNGKDYYFLSPEEFKKKIDQDAFIEWEEVYEGNFYGTLKEEIQRLWERWQTCYF
jgi:hypothetical protein